jgi:hypothetical protein
VYNIFGIALLLKLGSLFKVYLVSSFLDLPDHAGYEDRIE